MTSRNQVVKALLLSGCFFFAASAHAQGDSAKAAKVKVAEDYGHQLRLSFDLARPVINMLQDTRRSYEISLDYYHRNEIYFVAEAGFGSAAFHYPELSYDTRNYFVRLGFDKIMIKRIGHKDWDMAFFGLRYAVAPIVRDAATFTIIDSVWGNSTGSVPAATATAMWGELTFGVRVELLPGFMAGWNVRGKLLLNDRSFRELRPVFIAGYGRGDRSTVFDFNIWLAYAIRWGGKPPVQALAPGK